ncbi:A/G-specific adenine glycosylase [Buchnera aphidicola]|uniref:A/G-specific adenine glycosylase n=1 Tax=Buchnera aphidicola TaxID=9 RepID=UPI0012ABF3B6|nr:A/G-specific adenine glycosylase [Buchnera aphidicola]
MLFAQKILNWFHYHGRKNLPWQKKNIYLIWISEIMLQQTQVNTVIPYFNKFKKKFPTMKSLIKAKINEILYLWSGLGYYQRAHNIYKTAIIIKKKYNGLFPKNINEIKKLPGIGQSTAGAILSFAYNFGYAILDSNIKRILIRFHSINIVNKKKRQLDILLWNLINKYLPIHHANKFNQSMMDIGSLICTNKNPKCSICPLNNTCNYSYNKPFDIKKKQKKKNKIGILFSIMQYKNSFFIKKQNSISIWKGLFYFPITPFLISINEWKKIIQKKKKKKNTNIIPFTHYVSNMKLYIITQLIKIKKKNKLNKKEKIWYNIFLNKKIGIPSPVKKIFIILKKKIKEKNMKKKNKRIIFCSFFKKNAEGLDYPFFTGTIGQKIYQEISKKAWTFWLKKQTKIINEKKLNMFIDKDREYLERKMKKFLFSKNN